jgi:hypothetical protein
VVDCNGNPVTVITTQEITAAGTYSTSTGGPAICYVFNDVDFNFTFSATTVGTLYGGKDCLDAGLCNQI